MAKITLLTKDNTITVTSLINFTTVEMPYGARGFGFNGSSKAAKEELDKYWKFVEEVLQESNIPKEDYITLLEIQEY